MRRLIIPLIILTVCLVGQAQTDWQAELKKDLVTVNAGKMTMQEFMLLKGYDDTGNAVSMQLGTYSEAPTDGCISRDNFVGFTSAIQMVIILGLNEYFPEYEYIDSPIGNVDMELNVYMNKNGYQMEVKNLMDNTSERVTQTWADLFAE